MNNISPLDGRYADKTTASHQAFGARSYLESLVQFEVYWLAHILQKTSAQVSPRELFEWMSSFPASIDPDAIAEIERSTRHEIKAVELWLKGTLARFPTLAPYAEYVHILLTSEDTCTYAYNASCDRYVRSMAQHFDALTATMEVAVRRYATTPLLSRTHGQPASPTTYGKEVANVLVRLKSYRAKFEAFEPVCKISGAVGNFNAHAAVFPDFDWIKENFEFSQFVKFRPSTFTTQIEPKDNIVALIDAVVNLSHLLKNYAKNCWLDVSMGRLVSVLVPGQTGSSTMPHKVNPIQFENAEGNFHMAASVLGAIKEKIFESRWQRDLSDSTVLRSLGTGFAHFELAVRVLTAGLESVILDEAATARELEEHYEVLTEAVQQMMRKHRVPNAYEIVRDRFRDGRALGRAEYLAFVHTLRLPEEDMAALAELTPATYVGYAPATAKMATSLAYDFGGTRPPK